MASSSSRSKARKWEYRAEGCAVRAFASAGDPGRILLVSKKTELVEGRSGVNDDEADAVKRLDVEIWTKRHPEYASKATHLERREWFTRNVLEPILRETGVLVTGDLVDLREVDFDADDTSSASLGLFLPDAMALGHLLRNSGEGNAVAGDTMSFEFKPKSAAMPGRGALIDPRHTHKLAHTEHELQQRHKMWKGKIEALSRYEPRDFFAKGTTTAQGSAREIETSKRRALQGLFDCPQNNLIVYKNAVKIFPVEGASHATIEDAANLSMDDIIGALVQALTQQQAALDAISSLQERDTYGIEGIHRIYNGLLHKPDAFDTSAQDQDKSPEHEAYLERVRELRDLSRGAGLQALEDYMIACTFKDCSLIFTFAMDELATALLETQIGGSSPNTGVVSGVGNGERRLFYRAQLIDTDLKHVSKIPVHYKKDREIAALMEKKKCQPTQSAHPHRS